MGFGFESRAREPDEGAEKGRTAEAAVKCWFTSGGRAMPLSMKVKGPRGELLHIENIQVVFSERLRYAGMLTWRYRCRTVAEGREFLFDLHFQPEECRWKLVL